MAEKRLKKSSGMNAALRKAILGGGLAIAPLQVEAIQNKIGELIEKQVLAEKPNSRAIDAFGQDQRREEAPGAATPASAQRKKTPTEAAPSEIGEQGEAPAEEGPAQGVDERAQLQPEQGEADQEKKPKADESEQDAEDEGPRVAGTPEQRDNRRKNAVALDILKKEIKNEGQKMKKTQMKIKQLEKKATPVRRNVKRLERLKRKIVLTQTLIYIAGAIVFCTIVFFEAGLAIIAYGSRLSVMKKRLNLILEEKKKELAPLEKHLAGYQKVFVERQKRLRELALQRLRIIRRPPPSSAGLAQPQLAAA